MFYTVTLFREASEAQDKIGPPKPLDKQIGGGHYKSLAIQPVEYCQKNRLGCCESNVIKYVTRHRDKNGEEDIRKAIHTLNILLELEYGQSTEES